MLKPGCHLIEDEFVSSLREVHTVTQNGLIRLIARLSNVNFFAFHNDFLPTPNMLVVVILPPNVKSSLLVISHNNPPVFESSNPPFLSLARSILYQQLATKAVKCIYDRFISLFNGGESGVLPESVISIYAVDLRKIGVSGRKASYLHDLADKYNNGVLSDELIMKMSDEELIDRLTLVKGIGVWTVHMFMIFSLHRPDVLPVGDLGVRKGVKDLYGLKDLPGPLQMEQLCEKWRPYRSVGSWYMWRLIEARKTK